MDSENNNVIIDIVDANFENTVNSNKFLLLDFWASWCGPCRALSPILDELAGDLKDKSWVIGKINVDENSVTPSNFYIRNLPTLVIIVNGKEVDRILGLRSKEEILDKLYEASKLNSQA